jgi:hypothetical protein
MQRMISRRAACESFGISEMISALLMLKKYTAKESQSTYYVQWRINLSNGRKAPRVAKARGLELEEVEKLVAQYTDPPDFGILGDAGVNVLRLNLALDGMK